jgi:hypothetical protein
MGTIRRKAYLQDGEAGDVAEDKIICDGTFEDTPSVIWAGKVEE